MRNHSILLLAMIVLWIGSASEAKYSGGTGEPNDLYRIATPQDLNNIGNYEEDFDKHFILINDVNLAKYTGTQFKIIGNFTGVFDGNDHKIWNFTWNSTGRSYIGLFGYVSTGGQVKNLGMESVDVNAVDGHLVGGLVGANRYGTITNCYSSGSVSGSYDVGGLVGRNSFGTITNCYSTSSISADDGVGGLAGVNLGFDSVRTITNCYSTGNVTGDNWVGGLVGGNDFGMITNCYSSGNVTGHSRVGGLVGDNYNGAITASFWDMETSGQLTSDGGTGKTAAQMKTKSTFTSAGWDFVGEIANGTNDIWRMCMDDVQYPLFSWQFVPDFVCPDGVDVFDLAFFVERWLAECDETNNFCNCTDINYDELVNFRDFGIFGSSWNGQLKSDCFPSNHPDYPTWVAVGKPDCWCCPTQCHGDVNCDGVVDDRDANPIVPLIGTIWPDPRYNPCFDFDHNGRINLIDLEIIRSYYQRVPLANCLWTVP